MALEPEVLITLIAVIQAVFLAIWKLVEWRYKKYVVLQEKKKAAARRSPIEYRAMANMDLNDLLYKIGQDTKCDSISLSRFHNGGTFAGGMCIDKFTVTNSLIIKPNPHGMIPGPIHRDVLLGSMPTTTNKLLFTGELRLSVLEKDGMDQYVYEMMLSLRIKTAHLFLIKDIDGLPMAFVAVKYWSDRTLPEPQKELLRKSHNRILSLINVRGCEEASRSHRRGGNK